MKHLVYLRKQIITFKLMKIKHIDVYYDKLFGKVGCGLGPLKKIAK